MIRGSLPLGLSCPGCGSGLDPAGEGPGESHRLACPGCGRTFRARKRPRSRPAPDPPPMGGLDLFVRGGTLRWLPGVYHAGVGLGAAALLLLGGFVPAIRRWLDDDRVGLADLAGVVGGAWVATESRDPDADFGPVLRRIDAPLLFEEVAEVARRLGVRPPEEVRLAFLPCCGVVAWRRSRALLLGLPLLDVLTVAELRAILAHELAHLARGDDARSAVALRLVEGLNRALDDPGGRVRGPLRAWARLCRAATAALVGPIARGQEARADRASASIAGGRVAASALVKVAMVQPLFREVLRHHDPERGDGPNLYATFRALWHRLPGPLLEEMRLRLLIDDGPASGSPHPPLPDRVTSIQGYADRPDGPADRVAASSLLGDPEWIEQSLHDRLYGAPPIEPSVFHKAGT